jgi:hypothetical protein
MANRADRFYASPSNLHRKQRVEMWKDAVESKSVDFNAIEADRSTTVAEVTWRTEDDNVVDVEDAGLSAGIADVELTALNKGCADISCKATFADQSVAVIWWRVEVKDVD